MARKATVVEENQLCVSSATRAIVTLLCKLIDIQPASKNYAG